MTRGSLLCLALVLFGCTPTGDWNKDSIFFSPELADQRLAQQQRQLDVAQEQLEALRRQTSSLQGAIQQAKRATSLRKEDLAKYQREVDGLAKQLAAMRAELSHNTAVNAQQVATRDALQQEVQRLDVRIQQLRADLFILLEHA